MRPATRVHYVILTILGFALINPAIALGTQIFSAAGADAGAIQGAVDAFRLALGGVNNGNTLGSLSTGRREINWDGGGDAALATVFPTPFANFNTPPVNRGAVFTTPGTGFEISGQPNPRFGDINATYANIFKTFSDPRLFSPLGSRITDVNFFSPGTNIPASTSGFGAVFTDVDLPNITSIQYFDLSNAPLGTFFFVPTNPAGVNSGLSFLGVFFNAGEQISRVRITTGNSILGPTDGIVDTPNVDVVVLDDLVYGEPRVVPEASTLFLLGTGLLGVAVWGSKKRRLGISQLP